MECCLIRVNNQILQQTYLNVFGFINFQNNYFIVLFLHSIFTNWKRFLQTRLNREPEVLLR